MQAKIETNNMDTNKETKDVSDQARGIERRHELYVLGNEDALKILSSVQTDEGFELTEEFKANRKILGQIYDSIQRKLDKLNRKSPALFPYRDETYDDMQTYKRTVSDKTPMPKMETFEKLTIILAAQNPPFIHLIRELDINDHGDIKVLSGYSAPTETQSDSIPHQYQTAVKNSTFAVKKYMNNHRKEFPWEEKLKNINTIDSIQLSHGRVDQIVKVLFIRMNDAKISNSEDKLRIKSINSLINRRIRLPLLQQLLREKLIVAISCKDLQSSGVSGTEKLSDILLFNVPDQIKRRFLSVCSIIGAPWTREYLAGSIFESLSRKLNENEISRDEYFKQLATEFFNGFKTGKNIPQKLLIPVIEVLKMSDWLNSFEISRNKREEVDAVHEILEKIKNHGTLFRAKQHNKLFIPEHHLITILSGHMPAVLATTEPFEDLTTVRGKIDLKLYENIYLIFKDRQITATAIEKAINIYTMNGDFYLLRILENLLCIHQLPVQKLKGFIAPVYLENLLLTIKDSYKRSLPLVYRLWLFLTNAEISDARLSLLYEENRQKNLMKLNEKREFNVERAMAHGKKEVRKLAEERLKSRKKPPDSSFDPVIIKQIASYISESWDENFYPRERDILRNVRPETLEEVKKILSFAEVGAATVKSIVQIPITDKDAIFASSEYLINNRDKILALYKKRLQDTEEIVINEKIMSRKIDVKNKVLFQAIFDFVQKLKV